MARQNKSEVLAELTSDYLDAVVKLYNDDSGKLADAAFEAVSNIKSENLFKKDPASVLDSVSTIAIASILGY